MKTITVSEMRCFRSCQRKHHYRYRLGARQAVDADTLSFGKLVHSALEIYLHTHTLEHALDVILAAETVPEHERAKASAMMTGYHARWCDAGLTVIGVEKEFVAPMVNPHTGRASRTWQLGGKIDALASTPDGRTWIVEHKTSSEDIGVGSAYWQRLTLDPQISIYYTGARALGHEPAGCLYDVLRKPAIRPLQATPLESRKYKKDGTPYANQREVDETASEYLTRCLDAIAEDPDRYYQRGEIVRLEEDERDAAADAWQTARMMHESELLGRAPRNPDACRAYGRSCEYLPVCTRVASIDDPALYRIAEKAHEELQEVA